VPGEPPPPDPAPPARELVLVAGDLGGYDQGEVARRLRQADRRRSRPSTRRPKDMGRAAELRPLVTVTRAIRPAEEDAA